MSNINGIWKGEERIINGVGIVKPGPVCFPDYLAKEFENQGLFEIEKKPKQSKKEEDK